MTAWKVLEGPAWCVCAECSCLEGEGPGAGAGGAEGQGVLLQGAQGIRRTRCVSGPRSHALGLAGNLFCGPSLPTLTFVGALQGGAHPQPCPGVSVIEPSLPPARLWGSLRAPRFLPRGSLVPSSGFQAGRQVPGPPRPLCHAARCPWCPRPASLLPFPAPRPRRALHPAVRRLGLNSCWHLPTPPHQRPPCPCRGWGCLWSGRIQSTCPSVSAPGVQHGARGPALCRAPRPG